RIAEQRATRSTLSGSMTSVTTGSPVSRLASARYLSPSSSSPWKEYGDVRGLKAPPRKTRAPAALTFAATSSTCPRDSTEHGPAITTISYAVFGLKKKRRGQHHAGERAHRVEAGLVESGRLSTALARSRDNTALAPA